MAFLDVHGLRLGQAKYFAERSRWLQAANVLLEASLPLDCTKLISPSGPALPDGEVLLEALWKECCFSLGALITSERTQALLKLVNLCTTTDSSPHANIEVCALRKENVGH